jgi:Leucine-rich repeat (LRR) protein
LKSSDGYYPPTITGIKRYMSHVPVGRAVSCNGLDTLPRGSFGGYEAPPDDVVDLILTVHKEPLYRKRMIGAFITDKRYRHVAQRHVKDAMKNFQAALNVDKEMTMNGSLGQMTHLNGLVIENEDIFTLIANGSLGNLEWLNLGTNQIEDAGISALVGAIASGSLWNLDRLSPMKTIGDAGMESLSSAIAMVFMGKLQKLFLHRNKIGDSGMIAFANAIKPTPENPMGSLGNLEQLFLCENQIGDEGMKSLSSAIASGSMGKLEKLSLRFNNIGEAGMKSFAKAIKPSTENPMGSLRTLTNLHIDNNHIGDAGMVAFAEALKPSDEFSTGSLANITRLTFGKNQIGREGMKEFFSVLSSGCLASLTNVCGTLQ